MADLPPALVFGDDPGACLGAIRSLGRIGVPVHCAGWRDDLPAYSSKYCLGAHCIPAYKPGGESWVASIRALIERHGFALLVPTSDSSVAQLAAHADAFAPTKVAAPAPAMLQAFTDKWTTREMAGRLAIPVAPGRLVSRGTDAGEIADQLGLPVVLKAKRSYELGNPTQKSSVALLHTRADLARSVASADHHIVEGWIPGFCRGVSVLAVDGVVKQAFQHRRLRQKHATGPSSARLSEALDPRLFRAAEAMVAEIGYSGIAMFEFRCRDDADEFVLLEVNPRAWGSIQLAMDAGADFVSAQYHWLVEGIVPTARHDFPAGLHKHSLWGELEAITGEAKAARGAASWVSFARLAAAFAGRLWTGKGFDSHAPDDPAPFVAERAQLLARARRKALTLPRSVPRAAAVGS